MKKFLAITLGAGLAMLMVMASVAPAHAQAEKIKGKAKDLKKQIEGKAAGTNAPPQKPKSR